MKLLFECFILIAFFVAYRLLGIYPAISLAIALYSLHFLWAWIRKRSIDRLQWLTFGSVLILGGASLFFHNELFFKWKPSILYLAFLVAILVTQRFTRKPALLQVLPDQLTLPNAIVYRLDYAWCCFFAINAALNLWVAYTFDTEIWVYFKLFGTLLMFVLFSIGQAIYIMPHMNTQES